MKKKVIIISIVVILVALIVGAVLVLTNNKNNTDNPIVDQTQQEQNKENQPQDEQKTGEEEKLPEEEQKPEEDKKTEEEQKPEQKPVEDKNPEDKPEQKPEDEPQEETSLIKFDTAQDIEAIINNIYGKVNLEMPALATNIVDVSDSDSVSFFTGLSSNNNVEAVAVSEPMMSSQAYSFVLVKVSENADVESMKQQMLNNIDVRKWICVSAEKVYVTNYKNLICLVMSSEDRAKPVYNQFKSLVNGKVGKELVRSEQG